MLGRDQLPKCAMVEYTVSTPIDFLCTDILGSLPKSEHSANSILSIQDAFTNFVECYALPYQRSSIVADKIVLEFLSCYVVSNCIVIEDPNANLELFREACHLLEIHQIRTSGFRSIANGLVERLNSSLLYMVPTYDNQDQQNWDRYLPHLTSHVFM